LPQEEEDRWKKLLEIREQILPCLEKERQAGNIGKALDAKVTLGGTAQALPGRVDSDTEVLRELLNVSQLVIKQDQAGEGLSVHVAKADGRKCERCWHWETDVGASQEHPTLCARCIRAINHTAK
jgi:isoleucyl-tRNA synthetase